MTRCVFIGKRLRGSVSALAGIMLFAGLGTTAQAAEQPDGVRGATAVGHASATILHPTALRTDVLHDSDMDFAEVSGLPVAPAAVVRRDCSEDGTRQRCELVILDLP